MEEDKEFFFTDTHAHLASSRFEDDLPEVVERARAAKVSRILTISCDLEDATTNVELSKRYPLVLAAAGIHPLYVHEIASADWESELRGVAGQPEVHAIGEIGLDYFHPPGDGSEEAQWRSLQREIFEKQLQLAEDLDLPVVIHQRNSASDVSDVLGNFPGVRAVLHCFTGTPEEAETALSRGHLLSFTGILTFPKAPEVREVASIVPLDRLMIETDCPYLAPVPFRGKRCEPAHVVHVAETLAEIHGKTLGEMAMLTSDNASRFFGFPEPRS